MVTSVPKPDSEEDAWNQLSGTRPVCHCQMNQTSHADAIIAEHKDTFSEAYDRENEAGAAPSATLLNRLSRLREEPDSDDAFTADEGAHPRSGRIHKNEMCEMDRLASPSRWPVEIRGCPEGETRHTVAAVCGALGKVTECLSMNHEEDDRADVTVGFRYLNLLFARDLEDVLGSAAGGETAKTRLAAQCAPPPPPLPNVDIGRPSRPIDSQELELAGDPSWKRNYASVVELAD